RLAPSSSRLAGDRIGTWWRCFVPGIDLRHCLHGAPLSVADAPLPALSAPLSVRQSARARPPITPCALARIGAPPMTHQQERIRWRRGEPRSLPTVAAGTARSGGDRQ